MKKCILIFALLSILLIPGGSHRIGSGDTIICGYVAESWFSYPCMGPWPMETCDGYRVFLWDPPESYKGHYMMLVNPMWAEKCDEACGGCDSYIVDCQEAFYINSCAECSEPDDPCESIFCGEECFGCDLWMTECVDGECIKDYIIEKNSRRCGCGDPCEDVICESRCYGCDYWATECVDGECIKDYIIEKNSTKCGCGGTTEYQSGNAEDARKSLYQNYAKALDVWYWNNKGDEMLLMFGQDFYDSFTTPFGILKSAAKHAALGKYSSAELITKEVASLSGYLSCKDMGWTLSQTYLEAGLPYGFQERLRIVPELIREGNTGDAESEIRTLCSYLRDAYQNADRVGEGVIGADHEKTIETVETIMRAVIGFLEAECQEHCNSTCQCYVPEVKPEPEPEKESDSCSGTNSICFLMLFGIVLKLRQ